MSRVSRVVVYTRSLTWVGCCPVAITVVLETDAAQKVEKTHFLPCEGSRFSRESCLLEQGPQPVLHPHGGRDRRVLAPNSQVLGGPSVNCTLTATLQVQFVACGTKTAGLGFRFPFLFQALVPGELREITRRRKQSASALLSVKCVPASSPSSKRPTNPGYMKKPFSPHITCANPEMQWTSPQF